jgi:hypothetical protein
MSEIISALLEVQKELTNPKNTETNPFLQSKYAPLNEILNNVRPILSKNGVLLVQDTGTIEGTDCIFVQTRLLSTNGNGTETIESNKLSFKPDKNNVQGVGGLITYLRRYQLLALLGIMGEGEDDDGSGASKTQNGTRQSQTSHNQQTHESKTSKTSKTTGKEPKTGNKTPKTSKTAKGNVEAETSSVVDGNIKSWKEKAKNNPALKKVLDNLNNAGLDFHDANITAEAEDMNRKKTLTDGEYNKVLVALGKAPG